MSIRGNNVVPLHPKRKFRATTQQLFELNEISDRLCVDAVRTVVSLSAALEFMKKKLASQGSPFSLNPCVTEAPLPEDKWILERLILLAISQMPEVSENDKYALLDILHRKVERRIKHAAPQAKYA